MTNYTVLGSTKSFFPEILAKYSAGALNLDFVLTDSFYKMRIHIKREKIRMLSYVYE